MRLTQAALFLKSASNAGSPESAASRRPSFQSLSRPRPAEQERVFADEGPEVSSLQRVEFPFHHTPVGWRETVSLDQQQQTLHQLRMQSRESHCHETAHNIGRRTDRECPVPHDLFEVGIGVSQNREPISRQQT